MVQNVRRGFNPHGEKTTFFINLVIMYWTLNSIYMQFEYQYPKLSNYVSIEHVQLLRVVFGFFKLWKMLRFFVARGMYCLKLVPNGFTYPGGD